MYLPSSIDVRTASLPTNVPFERSLLSWRIHAAALIKWGSEFVTALKNVWSSGSYIGNWFELVTWVPLGYKMTTPDQERTMYESSDPTTHSFFCSLRSCIIDLPRGEQRWSLHSVTLYVFSQDIWYVTEYKTAGVSVILTKEGEHQSMFVYFDRMKVYIFMYCSKIILCGPCCQSNILIRRLGSNLPPSTEVLLLPSKDCNFYKISAKHFAPARQ